MTGSIHEVRDESLRTRAAWAVPLLPIALSGFLLSALTWLRLRGGPAPGDDGLAGLVVWLHDLFGFEPLFMVAVLTLAWSSIRFLGGELDRPLGRAGRIAIHGLCLAILVNLRINGALPANAGDVGAWFAGRLVDVFGPVFSILVVSIASLASLVLATDFFFYRYFEELAQRGRRGGRAEAGTEDDSEGLDPESREVVPAEAGRVVGAAFGTASAVPPESVDLSAPDDDRGIEDEAVEALRGLSLDERRAVDADGTEESDLERRAVEAAADPTEREAAPAARGPVDLDEAYEARVAEGHGGRRLSWRERRAIREVEHPTEESDAAVETEFVLRPGEGWEVHEVDSEDETDLGTAPLEVGEFSDDAGESEAEPTGLDYDDEADEESETEDWSEEDEEPVVESTDLESTEPESGEADEEPETEDWSEDGEESEAESTDLESTEFEYGEADEEPEAEDWSEEAEESEAESTELESTELGFDVEADEESEAEGWSEEAEESEAESTELESTELGFDVEADEESEAEGWSEEAEDPEAESTALESTELDYDVEADEEPETESPELAHADAADEAAGTEHAASADVVLQPVPTPGDPQGQQKSLFPIGPGDDDLLAEAQDLVVEYRRASRNFLRRRLRVSSEEAEDLLVELARRGVVSYRRGDAQGRVLVESA